MSVYTYKCDDCGNVFNVEASLEEKESGQSEKFICPKCKSKKISGHFSASNFLKNIFAGDKGCGCSSSGDSCCGGGVKDGKNNGSCCS